MTAPTPPRAIALPGRTRCRSPASALGLVLAWLSGAPASPAAMEFTSWPDAALAQVSQQVYSAAWGDANRDGRPDLYLSTLFQAQAAFLWNTPEGFRKDTAAPLGVGVASRAGAVWVDADNDGRLDLFLATTAGEDDGFYLQRENGLFQALETPPLVGSGGFGQSAMAFDVDRDGWVDLFVPNGGGWRPEPNLLLRGLGGFRFERVTTGSVATESRHSVGAASADYDGDGWPDLFVANIWGPGSLFRNRGDGTLVRIPDSAIEREAATLGASMGAWADFDNDGDFDLFTVNGTPANAAYRNDAGTLVRMTLPAFSNATGFCVGTVLADFDNDGWLDMIIARRQAGCWVLRGTGAGGFEAETDTPLAHHPSGVNGVAVADADLDGDLDVLLTNWEDRGPVSLFRNESQRTGNAWLRVRLTGVRSNREGVGARIRVLASLQGRERWQVRQVGGEDAQGSQEHVAHFGMADASVAKVVRVEWPSGMVQTLTDVAVRQVLEIEEQEFEEVASPHINRQTGLFEQTVRFRPATPFPDRSARIRIHGLPSGVAWLQTTGTDARGPYLEWLGSPSPDGSILLTLTFQNPLRVGIPSPTFSAEYGFWPPPPPPQGTRFAVLRTLPRPDGSLLLEFDAEPGGLYQIEVSEDMQSWGATPSTIRAGGNRAFWIDRGPPETPRLPGPGVSRFYRVVRLAPPASTP